MNPKLRKRYRPNKIMCSRECRHDVRPSVWMSAAYGRFVKKTGPYDASRDFAAAVARKYKK